MNKIICLQIILIRFCRHVLEKKLDDKKNSPSEIIKREARNGASGVQFHFLYKNWILIHKIYFLFIKIIFKEVLKIIITIIFLIFIAIKIGRVFLFGIG